MKLILLVLPLAFSFTSASSHEDGSSFIIGGSDATIEDYPYMAGVMNLGRTSCGGSIINSRSVLTAAHCIFLRIPATVSLFVGSSRRGGQGGNRHAALRVLIHPDYVSTGNPFNIQNDVAIIRTLLPIRFGRTTQPIPLGNGIVIPGVNVVLTGWGLTSEVSSSVRNLYCR